MRERDVKRDIYIERERGRDPVGLYKVFYIRDESMDHAKCGLKIPQT